MLPVFGEYIAVVIRKKFHQQVRQKAGSIDLEALVAYLQPYINQSSCRPAGDERFAADVRKQLPDGGHAVAERLAAAKDENNVFGIVLAAGFVDPEAVGTVCRHTDEQKALRLCNGCELPLLCFHNLS